VSPVLSLLLVLTGTLVRGVSASPATDARDRLRSRALETALARAEGEVLRAKDLHVDHSTWEDPWIARSRHYEVRTTASYFLAAKLAGDLDFLFDEFGKLLGYEDYTPAQKLAIWIFPGIDQYNALGGSGDEHSSFYGSFYADFDPASPVACYFDPNLTRLGMHVTHSACHQYLRQAFGTRPPLWVSEGLASYFALFWDWNWGNQQFRRLATTPGWIPVRELLGASLPDYLANGEDRTIELGMLFHYLLHELPETRLPAEGEPEPEASFRAYLRDILTGGDGAETGFARFVADQGGVGALEEGFRSYEFSG